MWRKAIIMHKTNYIVNHDILKVCFAANLIIRVHFSSWAGSIQNGPRDLPALEELTSRKQ